MDTSTIQAIKWSETSVHLKDLAVGKNNLPAIVKVVKGQYRNIGVSKSVFNELYIHSIKQSQKVMSEGIKIKNKKIVKNDQNFSLPVTFQGWFEVLSADGKAIKPIPTVKQLFKSFPTHCLVRGNIKAFIEETDGNLTGEKTRIVHTGEQLKLKGELNTLLIFFRGGTSKKRLLRCLDENGNNVYFNMDQKGLFSPIAGHGNISGVHNIRGLLDKFRFPIPVRLVHGIIPTRLDTSEFAGMFRLTNIYDDETAFVCPVRKDVKMVPISTHEPLKLALATNFYSFKSTEQVQSVHDKCTRMIKSYLNSIHILINKPTNIHQSHSVPEVQENSLKQNASKKKQSILIPDTLTMAPESNGERVIANVEEDILFEEVDDIYQYVREGGAPPPARPRPHDIRKSEKKKKKDTRTPKSQQIETTPLQQGSPEKYYDNDYWEEPIYAQLDEFLKKIKDTDLVAAGTNVSVNTACLGNVHQVQTNLSESPTISRAVSEISKHYVHLPPVPPKQYDSTEVLSNLSSSLHDTLDDKSKDNSGTTSHVPDTPILSGNSNNLTPDHKPKQVVHPYSVQISISESQLKETHNKTKKIPRAIVLPNQGISSSDHAKPRLFPKTTQSITTKTVSTSTKVISPPNDKSDVKANPVVINVGDSKPIAIVTASSTNANSCDHKRAQAHLNSTEDGKVNIKVITRHISNSAGLPKPREESTIYVVSSTSGGVVNAKHSIPTITSTIPSKPSETCFRSVSHFTPIVSVHRIAVGSPDTETSSRTRMNLNYKPAPFVAVAHVGDGDDRTMHNRSTEKPKRILHFI